MKRRLAAVAFALATGLAGVLLTPGAAHATPTGCSAYTIVSSPEGGSVYCNNGTGHFRAEIYCTNNPANGYGVYYFGPWKLPGSVNSEVYCSSSYPYVVAVGWDLTNS